MPVYRNKERRIQKIPRKSWSNWLAHKSSRWTIRGDRQTIKRYRVRIFIFRFIKKCLGAPSDTDVEHLKGENEELKAKIAHLEKQVQDLHNELEQERANH